LKIDELPTPCLIVDLDVLDKNIQTMANYCKSVKCGLRPHGKAHKSPFIARKQLDAGAVGLCVQTLEEAEAMILNGIGPILLTNMVASENAIERFLNLRRNGNIMTTVDSLEGMELLGRAASHRGLVVDVLVEINVGQNRTGVDPGDPAAKLASAVSKTEGLRFKGLMGYEGFLQLSTPEFEKRKELVYTALAGLAKSIESVKKMAGLEPEIVTSGGTGTYNITAEYDGVTEIQPGSYLMMDHRYNDMQTCGTDFQNSLTILSTVVSTPPDRVIVDMGWKAASVEYAIYGWDGMPHPIGLEGAKYSPGGDEHGILKFGGNSQTKRPRMGERIRFIPSHCDTTLNLHSKFYGVRGDRVEVLCNIAKR
jgi:D-serine deaminase-like pyridoxal phosphate-dependent protein